MLKQNNYTQEIIHTFNYIFLSKNLNLIIFPTEECNFRCIHCYEKFRKIYIYKHVIDGIINLIKSKDPEKLSISFFGEEPLLGFRYIQQIITNIKTLNIRFDGSITTNGFLLSKQYFQYLIQNNISTFQITIDGDQEHHNNQRNLPYKIDTFINKLSSDFANDDRYSILIYPVKDWGGYGSENIKQKKINLVDTKSIFDIYKYVKSSGLKIFDQYSKKYGSICYAGKPNSFIIRADGRIQKCTIALENDEINTIGYIQKNGNFYISEEKHKKWYSKNALNTKKCQTCKFVQNCFVLTCPLETIKNNVVKCCDYKIHYDFYKELENEKITK